ncbi:MAG: sensor histidine kinase [Acutalibacteraceae bacterium]
MFKKTRIKIVASIMSILVLLWAGTLGVIYASSYFELSERNKRMIMEHADMYVLSKPVDGLPPDLHMKDNGKPKFSDTPMFQLSTFYTVAISYDGDILEIKNNQPTLHTDEELKNLSFSIAQGSKTLGTENSLLFYKTDKNGYTLVTFMDNTIIHESATTLFRYTLIFGCAAMIIFFFLAVFLARKIVSPLEESYKKQKQFISDAGHELKTPVSVVSANAELLSREIGDNQWLANIQYENERMGLLVGQMLELARTENVLSQKERIDFSRLVNGEALPFEGVAFEQGLSLQCDIEPGIIIEGNSPQLKQVVSILLDNAIRHGTEKSEVRLILKKERNSARLSVINAGDEIPPEQRTQIFERFYRADPARNGEDKHFGLGLAIAKTIITAHKGRIEVLCYDGLVEFKAELPTV